MKGWKLAAVVFGTAALICAAFFIAVNLMDNAAHAEAITLWYVQGDCSGEKLEKLKKKYNAIAGVKGFKLELRAFADEAELGEGFNDGRPDLLLCSNYKAKDLAERGQLSKPEGLSVSYGEAVTQASPSAGSSYFPIGSRIQLLLMNEKLMAEAGVSESFGSLEELMASGTAYSKEKGSPFFSASSYADMISALMCSSSAPFACLVREDAKEPSFQSIYNQLADCGYNGGLLSLGEKTAQYVEQGLLPCACVCSGQLCDIKEKGLKAAALPLPEGGEKICLGELTGLAVTAAEPERIEAAGSFIQWLWEDNRVGDWAFSSGLLPFELPDSAGKLCYTAMAEILDSYTVEYYPADSEYFEKRAGFDRVFAETLDLLQ